MMKKMKKLAFSPAGTIVMFVAAVVLLLSSSIGGARAALTYQSDTYTSQFQMYDIGVTLQENWKQTVVVPGKDIVDEEGNVTGKEPDTVNTKDDWHDVSWRNYNDNGTWNEGTNGLLTHMLPDEDGDGKADPLIIGKIYNEEMRVRNSGSINQFVRVTIYKYWMEKTGVDKDGNDIWTKVRSVSEKDETTSPDNIVLNLLCDAEGVNNGWILDKASSTPERTILYYNRLLNVNSYTPAFCDTLQIDRAINWKVTETKTEVKDGYINVVTTFDYDGHKFMLEVDVDAVQEHNAVDAIRSAWGLDLQMNTDAAGNKTLVLPAAMTEG